MTTYRNNTDIDSKLVSIILSVVKPDGVTIDKLILRNKKRGHISGNWGKYFPREKAIVLLVPRKLPATRSRTPHTRQAYVLNNRVEWLVTVLAHELRHGYQWQVAKLGHESKEWKEIDAEIYELQMLEKWRQFLSNQRAAQI